MNIQDLRKKTLHFVRVPKVSLICLSGRSNVWMKMSMERWWSDGDRGKQKYSGKILSLCHSAHYKTHMNLPGMELVHLQ
jgi:hypothetical protein